jgi:antitoxin component of MazEF toxin-antitoxin module
MIIKETDEATIVLPRRICRQLHLKEDDKVLVITEGDMLRFVPKTTGGELKTRLAELREKYSTRTNWGAKIDDEGAKELKREYGELAPHRANVVQYLTDAEKESENDDN